MATRFLMVEVTIYLELKNDSITNLDDIYTDLSKVEVKYKDKTIGDVYYWTTGQVEEIKSKV